MSGPPRVTHQEIAQRIGCHKSTVSLALKNHPRISEAMRERVREVAKEMGYRPHPGLSMLAQQRWSGNEIGEGYTIAYVVQRSHSYYEHMQLVFLHGARERAEERGFHLLEFDIDDYPSAAAASRVLYSRGIQGLILSFIPPNDHASEFAFDWDKFAVVTLWHGWGRMPLHSVGKNIFESTLAVWSEVVARGYKRIAGAVFREEPTSLIDAARHGACLIAQAEMIDPQERIPFLHCSFSDKEAFLSWVDEHKPEVVISRSADAYEWLLEAGVRVPEDLAFACMNVAPGLGIAGASTMHREMGIAAVDYLVTQMYENHWGIPPVRHALALDPIWIEGPSLPDRRSDAPGSRANEHPLAPALVFSPS